MIYSIIMINKPRSFITDLNLVKLRRKLIAYFNPYFINTISKLANNKLI